MKRVVWIKVNFEDGETFSLDMETWKKEVNELSRRNGGPFWFWNNELRSDLMADLHHMRQPVGKDTLKD